MNSYMNINDLLFREKKYKDVKRINFNVCNSKNDDAMEYKQVSHEYGLFGFMCPYCYNIHVVKLNITCNVNVVYLDNAFYDVKVEESYCGICNNCKHHVNFIVLDFNIANSISFLCNKGFYTKYSCGGHDENLNPYILFEDKSILNYINDLPDTWYVDYDYLRRYNMAVIRSDTFQKDFAMKDLIDWIISLPNNRLQLGHYSSNISMINGCMIEIEKG